MKPKHTYTHRDKSGMLWRFDGSRPISKLADNVMDKYPALIKRAKNRLVKQQTKKGQR